MIMARQKAATDAAEQNTLRAELVALKKRIDDLVVRLHQLADAVSLQWQGRRVVCYTFSSGTATGTILFERPAVHTSVESVLSGLTMLTACAIVSLATVWWCRVKVQVHARHRWTFDSRTD